MYECRLDRISDNIKYDITSYVVYDTYRHIILIYFWKNVNYIICTTDQYDPSFILAINSPNTITLNYYNVIGYKYDLYINHLCIL